MHTFTTPVTKNRKLIKLVVCILCSYSSSVCKDSRHRTLDPIPRDDPAQLLVTNNCIRSCVIVSSLSHYRPRSTAPLCTKILWKSAAHVPCPMNAGMFATRQHAAAAARAAPPDSGTLSALYNAINNREQNTVLCK